MRWVSIRATSEALKRARAGDGPTLIEAVTYRLMMHTTSDDPTKYRDQAEVDAWWARDPIPRLRGYLVAGGLWDDGREERLQVGIKDEIDAAVKRFEALPEVAPDTPFDHVLGTSHPVIDEQRAEFVETMRRENDDG